MFGRLEQTHKLWGSELRLIAAQYHELPELQKRKALPRRLWHRFGTDFDSKNSSNTNNNSTPNEGVVSFDFDFIDLSFKNVRYIKPAN